MKVLDIIDFHFRMNACVHLLQHSLILFLFLVHLSLCNVDKQRTFARFVEDAMMIYANDRSAYQRVTIAICL